MEATTYTKEARYIARNDWAAVVNGAEIGYAASRLAAQRLADEFVAGQIEHDNQCRVAEVAALAAQGVSDCGRNVAPVCAQEVLTTAPALVVTADALAAVIEQARQAPPADKRWANALASAADRLGRVRWSWEPTSRRLLIHSARPETGHKYVVSAGMCDAACGAAQRGQPCWHRAARRLVVKAAHHASHAAG